MFHHLRLPASVRHHCDYTAEHNRVVDELARYASGEPMMEVIAPIVGLILVALFIFGSWRYFRRIRDGRVDPVVDPSWTTDMRPSSHRPLDSDDPPR